MQIIVTRVYGPINMGNPDEFTLLEPAGKAFKLVDANPNPTFHLSLVNKFMQQHSDITPIEPGLRWGLRVALEHGLNVKIAYFRMSLNE